MAVTAVMIPMICLASQTVELADGTEVRAVYGHIVVPERRGVPTPRKVTLPYIRLLSEADHTGAPLIYLRGGPGASGIETLEHERFAAPFRGILANRDIVLVDQRGTGDARPKLECWRNYTFPMVPSPTPAERLEVIKRLSMDCAEQMRVQGIDLAAYNTNESADDIADLARHLGDDRVILFGASYGSHLALAVLRRHESLIERAILALVEGPDDTYKRPYQLDDMLKALDDVAANPESDWPQQERPSLAIKQALQQFDQPRMASSVDGYGRKTEVEVARHDLELVLFREMGDYDFLRRLPNLLEMLRQNDWSELARTIINWREEWVSHPMGAAMDCASGASAERLDQIEEQLASSIASIPPDFPAPYNCEAWGIEPLPASFREPIKSDIPVLLISGELDARTPPTNADELAKGFPNATQILVGGVTHSWTDSYEHSEGVRSSIRNFLTGSSVSPARYSVPFKFERLGKASNR